MGDNKKGVKKEERNEDPWQQLKFSIEGFKDTNSKGPCVFYRGSENWLKKFEEVPEEERTKRIKQEVRALFAHWLKMQNVSVLLGAGASYCAGGPLGSQLYKKTKELITNSETNATLEAILNCVKAASQKEKVGEDFETFLSQLTALRSLSKTDDWPIDGMEFGNCIAGIEPTLHEKLDNLLLDLERAIIVTCNIDLPPSPFSEPHQSKSERKITPHEAMLVKLTARDIHQARAKIFTPNYDTLIEQAMDRLGILYCDGFTGTVTRRFNPAAYDLDMYYPGEITEGKVRRYNKVLHLYKLHGSINWRRTKTNISAGNPYGIVVDFRPIPKERDILDGSPLENILNQGESLAILPTAGKYGETLSMPFAHMFRAFAQALRQPQTVLFISGYSGWDDHINQIIEEALTNPSFTCVIINPSLSPWAKRLSMADASGRVYFMGGKWGTFEFFAHNILPDIEALKTDLDIAKTLRDLKKSETEDVKRNKNSENINA